MYPSIKPSFAARKCMHYWTHLHTFIRSGWHILNYFSSMYSQSKERHPSDENQHADKRKVDPRITRNLAVEEGLGGHSHHHFL